MTASNPLDIKRREALDAIAERGARLGRNIQELAQSLAANLSEFHGQEFKVCANHDQGVEFILIRPVLAHERAEAGQ
ncbi:MAG: hypothetical protein AB7P20_26155 [Rhizobiaceae bacterium]